MQFVWIKVSLWDCCIMPNDAWQPLGVFGVIPNPQNVHNLHVHGALLWKITDFFLHSIIWPLEIICYQYQRYEIILGIQKLGIFIVHWSKNSFCCHLSNFVDHLLFMRRMPKYSAPPCNIWKSFTALLPSWWINHIVLNGNLDNIFQILEQKYAKTEMVGGFVTHEFF